ncbi:hypothetical protein BRADI_5g16253v3 [Brachypodium distachyon]|uniref:Uncharacterized protein n=1 Tax=Brachypodium distachyon TaxID=15368 RepID=A0A2K2CHL7_BRADI|nr:hypothetical protein BRADI_5g16253v3 [Brachypodium distachyon]
MTAPRRIRAPLGRRRRIHLCLSFSLLPLFSLLCVPPSRGIGRRLGSRPPPPGRRARFLPPLPRRRARAQPPVSSSPDPATKSPLHTADGGHQPPVERRSSSSVNSRVERRSSSSVNSRVKSPRAPLPRRRSPRVPATAVEMSRQSHGFQ